MSWFKLRNIDTKQDYTLNGHVQRWTERDFAEHHRDRLIAETGQRHRVYLFYPPTVGNPKGGKPK